MKVPGYRSNDDLAELACRSCCKMRFQNLYACLHCFCSYQHLRNEDLIVLELLSDDTHGIDHTLLQDIIRVNSLIQCSLNCSRNLLGTSMLNQISNFFNTSHCKILRF